jgi:RND superfamily putative drug exporter
MAELLYRIGAFSARRAWIVITTWVLLLLTTAALMIAGNAKLATAVSVNGIPSQVVVDQLKSSFPQINRGSGQVVFHTTDGKPFTA